MFTVALFVTNVFVFHSWKTPDFLSLFVPLHSFATALQTHQISCPICCAAHLYFFIFLYSSVCNVVA